jgi:hypothetical protein
MEMHGRAGRGERATGSIECEMQKTIDSSSEAMTLLRRELDDELENYELLKIGNDSLLEERNIKSPI